MILLNQILKTTQSICLLTALLQMSSAHAQEWFSNFEERNGFSEFSPPNYLSDHDHNHNHDNGHDYKKQKEHWRSGSSFNDMNKHSYSKPYKEDYYHSSSLSNRRYGSAAHSSANRNSSSHANRNPWKPVKSRYGKQSFSSNRPWGKLPEQKRMKRNNMHLHDQRFKHWINQRNHSYQPQSLVTNSYMNYGLDPLHVPAGYVYSNSIQNGSLFNPALINSGAYPNYQSPGGFVPFTANNPGYYPYGNGYHPVNYYPYTGAISQLSGW